ncbi:hypothetical protein HPB51_025108 [Rhipicephalus microplus]|uniref:Uncharacterized protein n=1 Tax=Rhipicephalus microplus TaxID=6941 RepID=A0A9J6DKZ4_RHIMP|nr:hypothetical protein HPB51_025108 [Rhipicephalus microplus]
MHQMASITIPALPLTNTCSSLDPGIWALMNQRLALMNRKDLYVIVVTLLYSQPSCSKHLRRMYQTLHICDDLSLEASIKDPLDARSEVWLDLGTLWVAYGSFGDVSSLRTNGTFPVVTWVEPSDVATDAVLEYYASNAITACILLVLTGAGTCIGVAGSTTCTRTTERSRIAQGQCHSGTLHLCALAVPERVEVILLLVLFEAFPRIHQVASTTFPAQPFRRTCSAADLELWVLINQWLELMNREDFHAIRVALFVSSTCRNCVFICFHTNVSTLKWNGEETCVQLAAYHNKAKAAMDLLTINKIAAADGITDGYAQPSKGPQCLPCPRRCGQGIDQALLFTKRENLYKHVGVQVVPNTRCPTVLTYHFIGESMLRRNPEQTHHYTAAYFGVTQGDSVQDSDGFSVNPSLADGCRICDRQSLTVCTRDPLAARSEVRLYQGTPGAVCGSLRDVASV